MKQYLDIVHHVVYGGEKKENRTGVPAYTIAGAMFEHDMSAGFPLLTTKKMPFGIIKTELEFFIKGFTDKRWLQERGCHIWDEWCNPILVPYGHDEETRIAMREETDLGPVYGWEWRHFGATYYSPPPESGLHAGVDQLANVVRTLKSNPNDRRMIVTAWNPLDLKKQALPPCHYAFQVTVINGKLNLLWNQRSVDVMLGLPFNIASYGVLLHLLAKETGLEEGKLVGFLADVHVYENHMPGAREQLERDELKFDLPKIQTDDFKSIFDWTAETTKLIGYQSYPKIDFPIAI